MAASLFGGFVGTYLNELKPEDVARKEIPLSEVLPAPAGGIDTGVKPPEPPLGIGHYRKFPWAPEIKAIAIIPDFVVPTHTARDVLPKNYTRADVVSWKVQTVLTMPSCTKRPPTGIQPPTCSPTSCRLGELPTRPRHDLFGNAGQGAPAISPDSDPRFD